MIYRVKNISAGPIQLALHDTTKTKTEVMVLPVAATYDIPEEKYSEQITSVSQEGFVRIKKITSK